MISIAGKKHWLWRTIDWHNVVLDISVRSRHNAQPGAFYASCSGSRA
ncbi:hypothetical protein ACD578_26970 (plasmid) [Microvirga sp. RSM25]